MFNRTRTSKTHREEAQALGARTFPMKLPSPTQRQPYRYRTPNSLGHGACLDTYGNDTTTNAGFI